MGYRNILVLNRIHIGDCLFTTPALRALREGFAGARIVVTVPASNRDLLVANPNVDELMLRPRHGVLEKHAFLRAVRRRRFDLVVSFQERTMFYALAARLSGARMTVATRCSRTHRFYRRTVRRVRGEHEVEKYATIVEMLGLPRPTCRPELYVPGEHESSAGERLAELGWRDSDRVIGLNPGATQERKRWPEERFAALGDQMAAEWGCRVAIFGGPGDEALADRVMRSMASPAINLAGRLRLGETAASLRRCEIVISNDTGPLHMASALGVPVVGLFGPTSPHQFGPLGLRRAVLRAPARCTHCPHPCMHTIAVEDCFAAASHLLQSTGVRV